MTASVSASLKRIHFRRFGAGHLAECFLSGEPVPRQRRPYTKRTMESWILKHPRSAHTQKPWDILYRKS